MGEMTTMLEDFVKDTAKLLVDSPKDVQVTTFVSTKSIILQVKVAKSDCGKIIGKHGRTIDALKLLCLAIKNTKFSNDPRKVSLEVLEDENTDFKYRNMEDK